MNVKIGELSAEIEKAMNEMNEEVIRQVNTAAHETAKDAMDELRSTSPKEVSGSRRGRYAKGWNVKERGVNISKIVTLSVCNPTDYQLTHLLEYGHVIKATGGRAKAESHIKPVEEHAQEEFTEKVEDIRL